MINIKQKYQLIISNVLCITQVYTILQYTMNLYYKKAMLNNNCVVPFTHQCLFSISVELSAGYNV